LVASVPLLIPCLLLLSGCFSGITVENSLSGQQSDDPGGGDRNRALSANLKQLTTDNDVAVGADLTAVAGSSASLTYEILESPAHGLLTGTAPRLTYTPFYNYAGADFFRYRVSDGSSSLEQGVDIQVQSTLRSTASRITVEFPTTPIVVNNDYAYYCYGDSDVQHEPASKTLPWPTLSARNGSPYKVILMSRIVPQTPACTGAEVCTASAGVSVKTELNPGEQKSISGLWMQVTNKVPISQTGSYQVNGSLRYVVNALSDPSEGLGLKALAGLSTLQWDQAFVRVVNLATSLSPSAASARPEIYFEQVQAPGSISFSGSVSNYFSCDAD
jgi:hypothetical protein